MAASVSASGSCASQGCGGPQHLCDLLKASGLWLSREAGCEAWAEQVRVGGSAGAAEPGREVPVERQREEPGQAGRLELGDLIC